MPLAVFFVPGDLVLDFAPVLVVETVVLRVLPEPGTVGKGPLPLNSLGANVGDATHFALHLVSVGGGVEGGDGLSLCLTKRDGVGEGPLGIAIYGVDFSRGGGSHLAMCQRKDSDHCKPHKSSF